MWTGQNIVLLAVWKVAEGAEGRGMWRICSGESFLYVDAMPTFVVNVACAMELRSDSVLVVVGGEDFVGERCG